jgi:hypothetical protein
MNSIKLDAQFFLVKFPVIFPILYGLCLFNFPQFETELIIITILLLAETHFGATWPFLLDKTNYSFLKTNRISLVIIPIMIVIGSLLGFIFIKNFFLLIFFAANMYHVTRQSFGIGKLYCNDDIERKYQENIIYIINFLFFIIGILRFYYPLINESNIFYLNIVVLVLLFSSSLLYLAKFGFSQNFLIFTTGCLIFYPICFVGNPVHAIIMGVTMHYTQYLYLTYNVNKMRDQNANGAKKKFFSRKSINYLAIIIVYSIIMSVLSLFGKYDDVILRSLIIIPIIGQMLHFYLDSQLWKFSVKHNRDNTLSYLKKISY